MVRTKDREKAIALRKEGMSYSQIKAELGISKSTLSGWLRDMPLSKSRINALQKSDEVIEKIRQTKRNKKMARRQAVYEKVAEDIVSSKNIDFVTGFYLYWGEGTKTAEYTVSLTNSDPSIILSFVQWMILLGVPKKELRVKLHIYNDQDEKKLVRFWSDHTGIPESNFNKSYIKNSSLKDKNYKGMFGYGTCVVAYHDRDVRDYVLQGIAFLRNKYAH